MKSKFSIKKLIKIATKITDELSEVTTFSFEMSFTNHDKAKSVSLPKEMTENVIDVQEGAARTDAYLYLGYVNMKELEDSVYKTATEIEGIKPKMNAQDDIVYEIKPGVFKIFCDAARNSDEPHIFIIDEINRGNISKIFGELITLIEESKRAGQKEEASAILPYSGDSFSIPSNVYIIGTMNTADRSIALMDTALRRRFSFVEMMPDSQLLQDIKVIADGKEIDIAKMLDKMNQRIAYLYDREHTIGHAFFMKLKDSPTIETLQNIFEKSIIPLLQEYFYEDYEKIQLVLGDNGKENPDYKFISDENTKGKNIFKGKVEDLFDLPEKTYQINKNAFSEAESYIQIYQ